MSEHSAFKIIQITLTSTIGAAIIFTPKILAATNVTPYSSLIIILGAGLLSLVQAICYAELGRIVPGGGGDATYLKKAFSPTVAVAYNFFSFCAVIPACSAFGLSQTASSLSLNGKVEKFFLVFSSLSIILISERYRYFIFQVYFYLKIAVIYIIAALIFYLWWISDGGCLSNPPTSKHIGWFSMIKAFVNCTFCFSGYNTCNFLEMSTPLTVPYIISAILTTIIYLFFTAGQYAIFSWEQIIDQDTPLLLIKIPLSKLFHSSSVDSISLYSKRFIEFVLYFGPVLSCHAVFAGIFASHLTKDPIASYLVYILYGLVVYVICLVETAYSILNNTSILMSLFYCLTFLALFRLRRKVENPVNILIPLIALLVSGITTSIDVYEKVGAFISRFKL